MPKPKMVSALYRDVQKMVDKRGTLIHLRGSDTTFRRISSSMLRNKAKIISGIVKTIAAGLLSGGIGVVLIP